MDDPEQRPEHAEAPEHLGASSHSTATSTSECFHLESSASLSPEAGDPSDRSRPNLLDRVPPWVFLVVSVLIFSANNSVLRFLMEKGGLAFTACNILFASNLLGLLVFYPAFRKEVTLSSIRGLSRRDWAALVASTALTNGIGAYLYLEGLMQTSVSTTAIMSRLESVWFLVLAVPVLGERVGPWVAFNALLVVLGVVITITEPLVVARSGPSPGGAMLVGYVYLLMGGLACVVSLLISKRFLTDMPLGLYGVIKVALSAVFYKILSVARGLGVKSLEALWSPQLWLEMAWYGPLFVAVGQLCWLSTIARVSGTAISFGTSIMFVLNMVWAMLLLNRPPTVAELSGGAVILLSVASSLAEQRARPKARAQDSKAGLLGLLRLRVGQAKRMEDNYM